MEKKVERVPYAEHPDRCQSNSNAQGNQGGQCWNQKFPGSNYCAAHGANKAIEAAKKKEVGLYRLTQFQARLDEMIDGGGETNPVLGLRNEIGLARMKLEAVVNSCAGPADLLIHSQKINMTIQLIGKLVVDAKKLESSLGQLLDKSTVMMLCDQLVAIIGEVVTDPEKLTEIGVKVGAALELAVLRRSQQEEEN